MSAERWIVELEPGIWIGWKGRRTTDIEDVRVYGRWQDARCALSWEMKRQSYSKAMIVKWKG
jgi:hypothetical protein